MWIALTIDDIKKNVAPAIFGAASGYLATGQSDPSGECLAEATKQIRRAVAGNQQNALGLEGTIPDELKTEGGIIAAWEYVTRLQVNDPAILDVLEKKWRAVKDTLSLVRRGEIHIEAPVTANSVQPVKPVVKVVRDSRREMTRKKLKGML
jgi:hypothetical protein